MDNEDNPINERNECYSCIHKRSVAGNAHIACAKPSLEIIGDPHGIRNGCFIYPYLFDPYLKTNYCPNFKNKQEV